MTFVAPFPATLTNAPIPIMPFIAVFSTDATYTAIPFVPLIAIFSADTAFTAVPIMFIVSMRATAVAFTAVPLMAKYIACKPHNALLLTLRTVALIFGPSNFTAAAHVSFHRNLILHPSSCDSIKSQTTTLLPHISQAIFPFSFFYHRREQITGNFRAAPFLFRFAVNIWAQNTDVCILRHVYGVNIVLRHIK